MAKMDLDDERPSRYTGQIVFDPALGEFSGVSYATGGRGRGSAPFGDYPITDFVAKTPKYSLEGFALNNASGNIEDPKYPGANRSGIMLHLAKSGKTLEQLRSAGCLVVSPSEWPALRDNIIKLQKEGYDLVAHLDPDGNVTIRTADSTAIGKTTTPSEFIGQTNSTREDIGKTQSALAAAGFDPGPIDGYRGPQTEAAIKAFQEANGLKVDGIAGKETLAKLRPVAPTSLKKGAEGDEVYGLQTLLDSAGFSPGMIDGKFGPKTESALKAYQEAKGLKPDGIAGEKTFGSFMGAPTQAPTTGPTAVAAATQLAQGQSQGTSANALMPTSTQPATTSAPAGGLKLASGKTIAPGVYPSTGGYSVRVTDDGTGKAKIERVRGPGAIPGVIDPMKEAGANTVAGGFIRKVTPAIVADAAKAVPETANALVQGAKTGVTGAKDALADNANKLAPLANALPGGQLLGLVPQASLGSLWDSVTKSIPKPASVSNPETRLLTLVSSPKLANAEGTTGLSQPAATVASAPASNSLMPLEQHTVQPTRTFQPIAQPARSNFVPSGRTRASVAETAENVWNEARGG